jgi:hypothetical protein
MKNPSVLFVGITPKFTIKEMHIDRCNSLAEAKLNIKSKFYDSVITSFHLPDGSGPDITHFFPHYRTIIITDKESKKNLKNYRNGFFAILCNLKDVEINIKKIIENYPKKEQDTLLALINIQGSIEELTKSQLYIKSSFGAIHSKLKTLEKQQLNLNNNFTEFKRNREKTEQFYIDTLIDLREKI